MTALVTGASGLLGSTIKSLLAVPDAYCPPHATFDVSDFSGLSAKIAALAPSIVINCAADTDVEGGESNPDRSFAANAILPDLLAQICSSRGIPLVHFSSTGCYGRWKEAPYDDFDELRPTTVHHRSKAVGEASVRAAGGPHLILRLGWLYGGTTGHRKNFVWARIKEARSKPDISSDPFQSGVPSWVGDVAAQTKLMLDAGLRGTFNCVAKGAASRFDYVQAILDAARISVRLRPQRFARLAKVSPNEAAVNYKLNLMNLNNMPEWQPALEAYIGRLLAEEAR